MGTHAFFAPGDGGADSEDAEAALRFSVDLDARACAWKSSEGFGFDVSSSEGAKERISLVLLLREPVSFLKSAMRESCCSLVGSVA